MPNQVQLVYITPSNQRIIQIDDSVKTIYISRLKGKGIAKITDFTYNIDQEDLTIQNRLLNTSLVIRNNYTENPLLVAIKYLQEPPPKVRIIIPGVKDEKKEEKIFSENPTMFQFHVTSPADRKYIILRTYTIHYSSGPLHILMHPSQPATKDNYQSASNLYHENVIVVRSDYAQNFFITVYCPEKCNGKLSFYRSDHVHMLNNDHFEFVGSSDYYNLVLERSTVSANERIQLTLLSPQTKLETKEMQIGMMNNNNEVIITDVPVSGLLIAETELSCVVTPSNKKYGNSKYIYIRVHGPAGQYMRFTTRTIGNSQYLIGDPAIYILKSNENDLKENDCIDFYGEKKGQIYQFRLVSTYGVIMYINNRKNVEVGYMENKVEYYTITENNAKTSICFRANDTTSIGDTRLKTVKLALYFQVVNTDANSMKAMLEPMYDGWKYTDKLKFGESKFYRYAKQTSYKTIRKRIKRNKRTIRKRRKRK